MKVWSRCFCFLLSGESLSFFYSCRVRSVSTPFLFLSVPSPSFISSFVASPPLRYPSRQLHSPIFSPSPAPAVGHGRAGALQEVHGAALLSQRARCALRVRRDVRGQLRQPDVLGGRVQAELAGTRGCQVSAPERIGNPFGFPGAPAPFEEPDAAVEILFAKNPTQLLKMRPVSSQVPCGE